MRMEEALGYVMGIIVVIGKLVMPAMIGRPT